MDIFSLRNKIFFKIGTVLAAIIIIYVLFITFVISPKITNYLIELETNQAKTQLDRISSIITSKEKYLKEFNGKKIVEHRENIRNISFIAHSIMSKYHEMYKNGSLSKDDAIKSSFEIISKIKYGHDDDYIYVLDREGTLLFHPDKRYHNKNIYNTKDAKGNLFVEKIINNSVLYEETYTTYSWSKLNSEFISEKIVHSVYFKPFDLIISSGVYVENIKQEFDVEKEKVIGELEPLIKSIVLEETGYIYIVNSESKIVLHPSDNFVLVDFSSVEQPETKHTMMDGLLNSYKKNQAWRYKWNRIDDTGNFSYEKIAWTHYNKFFEWYVVSSIYEEDLEIKANEINGMIRNISLLILIILTFIAIVFIRKLLYPITVLSRNADLVKNGNLEIRNNMKIDDEIGSLANHFDKMLDSIQDNTKNLESRIEERTAEIKHKLYYDELTGLKNRESLLKDLDNKNFTAVSLIDIDGFDDINELYGFDVGNEILIKVKDILEEFSSKNDISLYRLNSDIFVLLDNHMERFSSYDSFLNTVQEIFRKEILVDSLEIELYLYITIGSSISQFDPVKSANIALKNAKEIGTKFLVYNKSIDTKDNIKKTMYWREKIKDAILEDKVIPFFQPIVDKNRNIVKYETLMRIHDEVDGKAYYLSPGSFFDVAIKTKQYFKLNQIVILKALKKLPEIKEEISINLSFADVLNIEFNEMIEKEIKKLSQDDRQRVVFEILESDVISDYEILDDFIFKYRKLGVKIAIDDFGTGFSNFSHILKVKPDFIKIDGSLIKDINNDEKSYEMVKAIVDFSRALNIVVIAEFIHSKEVFDIVKQLDVEQFQGYYLGEPGLLI